MDVALLNAIVDTGSLREVARTLGLTQSAVTRRLSRFEARVGARLVHREDEAMRLTEAGWALFSAGHRFLQTLGSSLRRVVRDAGNSAVGLLPMLRLAAFGNDWCDLAEDLATHLPGMLLRLVTTEPSAGFDLFERHAVDALYAWTVGDDPQTGLGRPVLAETVLDEPMWVSLPAHHLLAAQDKVSMTELADEDWIVGTSDECRALTLAAGREAGFEPRIAHVVQSGPEMRSLLVNGWGIALNSPLTVSCQTRAGFVCRPLVDAPTRKHVLYIDPTVVSENLAEVLRGRLAHSYLAKAQKRNTDYLASSVFPRLDRDEPERRADPRLFAGLSVAPRATENDSTDLRLEPEDLHLLRVVGDCGSLNRAAPVLLITQPALTRRISRLERRLGLQLLLRGHRGTALTAAARRLLDGAAEAEAYFHSVSMAIRDQNNGSRKRLDHETQAWQRVRRLAPGAPRPCPDSLGAQVRG
jgi:DNA-binding transcriptional LysR family regulator